MSKQVWRAVYDSGLLPMQCSRHSIEGRGLKSSQRYYYIRACVWWQDIAGTKGAFFLFYFSSLLSVSQFTFKRDKRMKGKKKEQKKVH